MSLIIIVGDLACPSLPDTSPPVYGPSTVGRADPTDASAVVLLAWRGQSARSEPVRAVRLRTYTRPGLLYGRSQRRSAQLPRFARCLGLPVSACLDHSPVRASITFEWPASAGYSKMILFLLVHDATPRLTPRRLPPDATLAGSVRVRWWHRVQTDANEARRSRSVDRCHTRALRTVLHNELVHTVCRGDQRLVQAQPPYHLCLVSMSICVATVFCLFCLFFFFSSCPPFCN
eukprot:SAG31_NODE_960_length_10753_cov_7.843064_9_plen_232_part_00